ncbi:MAG: penicillin-binding protein [Muribaculaceae bacterium]
MKQNNKKNIIFRFELVIACMLIFAILIILELTRTTIVLSDKWNEKAENLIVSEGTIVPQRGEIYSDNGCILAADITFFNACIDFKAEGLKVDSLKKMLPALCDSLAHFRPGKTKDEWKQAIEKQLETRQNRAFTLFTKLTDNDVKRMRTFPFLKMAKRNTGFYTTSSSLRTKPFGSMAARSIGNVGEVIKGKINDRPVIEIHGRSGLEMALDTFLYGTPGVSEKVQVTTGMAKIVKKPAIPGYNITTTINVALQDIVEDQMLKVLTEEEAEWGSCVLMEVATGEIKAISNLEWNAKENAYVEGVNHAVLGYEPGSVMKPISMMVALEDGLVSDIDQPIATGHSVFYEGRGINDHPGGVALTPRQIIETSSNIGMSKIITSGFSTDKGYAKEPGKFRDRLEELGFFEPFNTGIAGERVPTVARLGNKRADRVALTRMCYGYSTLIPPLRTLAMYNAIANNGHYVRPHLVKKFSRVGEPDSIVPVTYIRHQVCDSINAAKLRIMLHDVVWGDHGTARSLKDKDVELAGKTGTCFVTEIGADNKVHYNNQRRRLAFCGFFPYEKPKYSCIVLMKGAKHGAAGSSGRVMLQVAKKMYAHGLLGTGTELKKTDNPNPPTIYASENLNLHKRVTQNLNIAKAKAFATPKTSDKGGVPNVKGLSAREAIARLENAGLVVAITGSGYVANQSLAAGSAYRRGQQVTLYLQH